MNKYITRYYNNNDKEQWENLAPTWTSYLKIIMKILKPSKGFRKSKYQIYP